MTLGVGAILSEEPADIVRRLTFATKEAVGKNSEDLFYAMARVNLSHAIMLKERRLAPEPAATALVGLMREIFENGPASVPLSAENGDLYPQIEAHAAERLGHDVAGYLQLGRSRGDVIPSAMRIKLRIKEMRLLDALITMREVLLKKAEDNAHVIMPAYTHWQQSQIMTVGHFLGRFCAWLERDTERLFECINRHNLSVLGCANGVGTSVQVDRDMTSRLLAHDAPTLSSGDGTNAWDYMIEPVSEAALLCSHLARLMGNFILWHTQEFGMVRMGDAFCTASTYLPHKRNPEPLETVKVFAEQVQGSLATVYLMARNEDWPHSLINHGFEAMNSALDLSTDAVHLTAAILEDIQVDQARMREHLDRSFSTASEVANTLVVTCKLPFREAHEIVGTAVRECLSGGHTTLTPEMIRRAAQARGLATLAIDDEALRASIDPDNFVYRISSSGGTAPEEVRRSVGVWREQLTRDAADLKALQERFEAADDELLMYSEQALNVATDA